MLFAQDFQRKPPFFKITAVLSSGETLSFVGCSAERLPDSSGSLTAQQFVAWWLLMVTVRPAVQVLSRSKIC